MSAIAVANMDYRMAHGKEPIPHVPRESTNFPGSDYLLPADEKERARLILQHNMMTKAFGGKLVQAPMKLDEIHSVLDSGTGTAVWITELAREVSPSAELHGIDINTGLIPTTLPSNVSISVNSVTNLPLEWTGRFDLFHQRLLMGALRKLEWIAAISEMYRVLRPGGWVQLLEASEFVVGTRALSGCQAKLVVLLQQIHIYRDLLVPCASQLPLLLEQAGFCNVTVERRFFPLGSWGGEIGSVHSRTLGEVFRGMKTPILQAGGFGIVNSEEEFDHLLDDVESEWNDNVGNGTAYYLIVAQKPDTSSDKAGHQ